MENVTAFPPGKPVPILRLSVLAGAIFLILAMPLASAEIDPLPASVIVIENQSQILDLIIRGRFRNITVLHVDSHDGLWPPPSPGRVAMARSLLAESGNVNTKPGGLSRPLRSSRPCDGNNVLALGHRLGLIKKVFWAYPKLGSLDNETLQAIKQSLESRDSRLGDSKVHDLRQSGPCLTGTISGVPVTIGSIGNFSSSGEAVLLDIGLDFFPPFYRNPVASTYRGILSGFAGFLRDAGGDPALVVISYSHPGGYLPTRLRFLGPWLRELLQYPDRLAAPPKKSWVRKEEAWHQEYFQQFEEAVSIYEEILRDAPGDPDVLYSLALAQLEIGSVDNALRSLEMAVRLDERYVAGYAIAAERVFQKGSPELALEILDSGRQLESGSPEILDALGRTSLHAGKYPESITYFKALIATGSGSPLAHAYLGDAYRLSGVLVEAGNAYREAVRQSCECPDAMLPPTYWRALGEVLEKSGKQKESTEVYREYLARFPDSDPSEIRFVKERLKFLEDRLVP